MTTDQIAVQLYSIRDSLRLTESRIRGESVPGSVFKEIGRGNLNWMEICAAAEESGCRAFVVEQDAHWIGDDPFESLKVSFQFIRESLCR